MTGRLPAYIYEPPERVTAFVILGMDAAGDVVSMISEMPQTDKKELRAALRKALEKVAASL